MLLSLACVTLLQVARAAQDEVDRDICENIMTILGTGDSARVFPKDVPDNLVGTILSFTAPTSGTDIDLLEQDKHLRTVIKNNNHQFPDKVKKGIMVRGLTGDLESKNGWYEKIDNPAYFFSKLNGRMQETGFTGMKSDDKDYRLSLVLGWEPLPARHIGVACSHDLELGTKAWRSCWFVYLIETVYTPDPHWSASERFVACLGPLTTANKNFSSFPRDLAQDLPFDGEERTLWNGPKVLKPRAHLDPLATLTDRQGTADTSERPKSPREGVAEGYHPSNSQCTGESGCRCIVM